MNIPFSVAGIANICCAWQGGQREKVYMKERYRSQKAVFSNLVSPDALMSFHSFPYYLLPLSSSDVSFVLLPFSFLPIPFIPSFTLFSSPPFSLIPSLLTLYPFPLLFTHMSFPFFYVRDHFYPFPSPLFSCLSFPSPLLCLFFFQTRYVNIPLQHYELTSLPYFPGSLFHFLPCTTYPFLYVPFPSLHSYIFFLAIPVLQLCYTLPASSSFCSVLPSPSILPFLPFPSFLSPSCPPFLYPALRVHIQPTPSPRCLLYAGKTRPAGQAWRPGSNRQGEGASLGALKPPVMAN